ncbi:MAG TPA: efflux RND transporter periplasmic adaptor subunit [Candidatus Krumholzibacteriaceae bacterium]
MNALNVSCTTVGRGALILCFGALLGCGAKHKSVDPGAASTHTVAVEAAVAEMKSLSVTRSYSGSLEGEEQAHIVARLSERVTGTGAQVGESVRAGQIIISLDKNGASSQYYQAEANFTNAGKTLDRMKSLYADGAISLQSLDGVQTAYDVAKTNFEAARSNVELTTPIAGLVTAVNVSAGDMAAPGSTLATVAKIDRMKIVFNIDEIDATNLHIAQKAFVYSDTRPDTKMEGEIIQLSKSADARSRSFEIKARFPNTPDRWFRPGMYCRVDVQVSSRGTTLTVPNAAIQSDGTSDRVYVVRGGRAFQRTVHIGLTDGQTTAITGALAAGDTVATVGVSTLRDSSLVKVVNK